MTTDIKTTDTINKTQINKIQSVTAGMALNIIQAQQGVAMDMDTLRAIRQDGCRIFGVDMPIWEEGERVLVDGHCWGRVIHVDVRKSVHQYDVRLDDRQIVTERGLALNQPGITQRFDEWHLVACNIYVAERRRPGVRAGLREWRQSAQAAPATPAQAMIEAVAEAAAEAAAEAQAIPEAQTTETVHGAAPVQITLDDYMTEVLTNQGATQRVDSSHQATPAQPILLPLAKRFTSPVCCTSSAGDTLHALPRVALAGYLPAIAQSVPSAPIYMVDRRPTPVSDTVRIIAPAWLNDTGSKWTAVHNRSQYQRNRRTLKQFDVGSAQRAHEQEFAHLYRYVSTQNRIEAELYNRQCRSNTIQVRFAMPDSTTRQLMQQQALDQRIERFREGLPLDQVDLRPTERDEWWLLPAADLAVGQLQQELIAEGFEAAQVSLVVAHMVYYRKHWPTLSSYLDMLRRATYHEYGAPAPRETAAGDAIAGAVAS